MIDEAMMTPDDASPAMPMAPRPSISDCSIILNARDSAPVASDDMRRRGAGPGGSAGFAHSTAGRTGWEAHRLDDLGIAAARVRICSADTTSRRHPGRRGPWRSASTARWHRAATVANSQRRMQQIEDKQIEGSRQSKKAWVRPEMNDLIWSRSRIGDAGAVSPGLQW